MASNHGSSSSARFLASLTCAPLLLLMMMATSLHGQAVDDEQLPAQLRFAVEGWRHNVDRIKSIEAEASLEVRDPRFAEIAHRAGIGDPTQLASVSTARDGDKVRLDVSFNRVYSLSEGRIVSNLPFGKFVQANMDKGRMEEMYKLHGTPRTTQRILQVGDRAYDYFAEAMDLTIQQPRDIRQQVNVASEAAWLVSHGLVFNHTLPAFIYRAAKLDNSDGLGVVERQDGQLEIVLKWHNVGDGVPPLGKAVIVLDPKRGYTISKCASYSGDRVDAEAAYQYAEVGGAWVLMDGASSLDSNADGSFDRVVTSKTNPASVRVNEAVDPQRFEFAHLGVQKGARVADLVSGTVGAYDDVPTYVKVALMEAESDIASLRSLDESLDAAGRAAESDSVVGTAPRMAVAEDAQVANVSSVAGPRAWYATGLAATALLTVTVVLFLVRRARRRASPA